MADDEDRAGDPRYRAPALEKGLDVLELLAAQASPMTLTAIVHALDRSHGELFRMVQVLEHRGYIEHDPSQDGYRLTDRLFSLGMQQPRTANLIEAALPVMRRLAFEIRQSCHLALHTRGQMVVVARMESGEQLGFSVRVGYRQPLMQTASGMVLYAYQPADVRKRWEAMFDPPIPEKEMVAVRAQADEIAELRVAQTPSHFVAGVIDISAPVMRGGAAAAALTVPFLKKLHPSLSLRKTAALVREAADTISEQLVEGDSRI
jgi:DNA-binding IclR family transcriptional regulator